MPPRNAPSAANLIKYFQISRDAADLIRSSIKRHRKAEDALEEIGRAEWITNYGLEELVKDKHALPSEWRDNVIATYLNTGDTYSATLIARNGRVYIGCWGDLAEKFIPEEAQ